MIALQMADPGGKGVTPPPPPPPPLTVFVLFLACQYMKIPAGLGGVSLTFTCPTGSDHPSRKKSDMRRTMPVKCFTNAVRPCSDRVGPSVAVSPTLRQNFQFIGALSKRHRQYPIVAYCDVMVTILREIDL